MKKFTLIFVAMAGILFFNGCSGTELPVVCPQPLSMVPGHGTFTISPDVVIDAGAFDNPEFLTSYLQQKILLHTGIDIAAGDKTGNVNTIVFSKTGGNDNPGPDGYRITTSKHRVIIEAGTGAGIFYGINTLIQLIRVDRSSYTFYPVKIVDSPAFAWRGMHLDVSRHFFPVEFIKIYIDILALHKMNVFHWHLTDDQGWRIEIDKYPKLTSVAAWRTDHTNMPWNYDVTISGDHAKNLYGGFYTKDEIREIVRYARERYVTIVPEIEMPGHSRAALTAYPGLTCSGKPYRIPEDTPFEFTDPYCAGNDSVFTFLQDVLSEVMELFPSTYIHIGGDEAKKTPWENCPLCQKRMREEGLENTEQLQAWFISQIDNYLREKGRKTIGWDEIMEGNLPTDAAIMAWRDTESAGEALREGYNTVVATSRFYYFSSAQDNTRDLPSRVLSLQDVLEYNPVPDSLTPEQSERLLGVSGSIWTENIQNGEDVEIHLLPRLAALANTAWSGPHSMDYETFIKSMPRYFKFLDAESLYYYLDSPKGFTSDKFYTDDYSVRMHSEIPGTEIRYTLDGSEPEITSPLYTKSISVKNTTTVKAMNFLPSGKSSPVRMASIEKVTLNEAMAHGGKSSGLTLKTGFTDISSLDDLSPAQNWETGESELIRIPENLAGKDHFVLEFSGFFNAPEDGIYQFFTTSDDGSRLYIDDHLIVDNDGIHGSITASGQTGLAKGSHRMKVLFFEANYGESLKVEMEGPEIEKDEINEKLLTH